jgi:hypothetical protein
MNYANCQTGNKQKTAVNHHLRACCAAALRVFQGEHISMALQCFFTSGKPTRGEGNSITLIGRYKANVLAFTR